MWPFNTRRTDPDALWQRVRATEADITRLEGSVRSLSIEWSDALSRINRAIARLERGNERAEKRDRKEQLDLDGQPPADVPVEHGFLKKFQKLNRNGGT